MSKFEMYRVVTNPAKSVKNPETKWNWNEQRSDMGDSLTYG